MAIAPELVVGALAIVVVGAGVASIAGSLKRTAARKSYASGDDGGPIYGGTHSGKSNHHDNDGGSDGGGDGGGGD
jgi:hypothetical protein